MGKRIFIIDDEADMLKIATDLLESDGFLVGTAEHPVEGLKRLRENPPDLLLLDVRLPDMDGFETLREIKSDPKIRHVPVVMVSVKAEEADVVVGLELGAEDYITKPFRRRELLARVKTVLRRKDADDDPVIEIGPIRLDWGRYAALVRGKPLTLTPKEFELLGFFLRKEGRVLTRAVISENVWGVEWTGSTRTIDVHVDQLRRKLGAVGQAITGIKGVGYRFELQQS